MMFRLNAGLLEMEVQGIGVSENALIEYRGSAGIGVLRLRTCFALRTAYFAQDDKTFRRES